MGIFSRKKKVINPPSEDELLQAAKDATDALNVAIDALQNTAYRHIRGYVRSGDQRVRRRSKVMLGYWGTYPDLKMIIVHGDDVPGMN